MMTWSPMVEAGWMTKQYWPGGFRNGVFQPCDTYFTITDLGRAQLVPPVAEIRRWARDNYDKGGHWIEETMTDADIAKKFKTLADAKRYVRHVNGREADCRFE